MHTQKREPTAIGLFWVSTPFGSNICRKPTYKRERFALFKKAKYSSCREMNKFQNKANAYFNLIRHRFFTLSVPAEGLFKTFAAAKVLHFFDICK